MQNRRRLALGGIGVLAFGASAYQVVFSDRIVESVVRDLLSASLAAPCHLESARFSFAEGLEVRGLEVLDPTDPLRRKLIEVDRAALDFRLGLFGHGMRIDSIELDGAHVHLTRLSDGTFPMFEVSRSDALPTRTEEDEPEPPAPDVIIRSGSITYTDPQFLADGVALTIEDIRGGLRRDPPGLPTFTPQPHLIDVEGRADVLGRVRIAGTLAPYLDPHTFTATLSDVVLDAHLSDWLAPHYAETLRRLSPRGAVGLTVDVHGRSVADAEVEARLELRDVGVSFTLPNPPPGDDRPDYDARKLAPIDVDGISGAILLRGDTAVLEGVGGRALGATLNVAGTVEGVRSDPEHAQLDLLCLVDELHASTALADRVPYGVTRVLDAYSLDVMADARVTLTGAIDAPSVRARADVLSGTVRHRGYVLDTAGRRLGFPWSCDIAEGTVTFDQTDRGRVEIAARGRHGGATVDVAGELLHPEGEVATADVWIHARDVDLGADVRAGFGDRADRVYDRWAPEGIARAIDVHVFNDPVIDGHSTQTEVTLEFDGRATFRPRELPTPIRVTEGRVEIARPVDGGRRIDEVRIANLRGVGDAFELTDISGAVTGDGDDAVERLHISGSTSAPERALLGALDASTVIARPVKEALARMEPRGAMGFEVRLGSDGGVRRDSVEVRLDDAAIRGFADVPLPARHVTGVVTVEEDLVTLEHLRGEVFDSVVTVDGKLIGPGATPSLDVSAPDLAVGPTLRAALGPIAQRAAPFFDVLHPTDATRADVAVSVRPPGDPAGEVRADLTHLHGPVAPLGVALDVRDASLHSDGHTATASAVCTHGGADVEFPSLTVAEDGALTARVVLRRLRFPDDLAGLISADAVRSLGKLAAGRLLHTDGADLTWTPGRRALRLAGPIVLHRDPDAALRDPGTDLTGELTLSPLELVFGKDGVTRLVGVVSAKDAFVRPGIDVRSLSAKATLSGATGPASTDIRLDVTDLACDVLARPIRSGAMRLRFRDGVTRIDELSAKLHGGDLTGNIVAGAPDRVYGGHLEVRKASAERVLGVDPLREMGGELDLTLDFENKSGAQADLRGAGLMTIRDANLAEIPLITAFSMSLELGRFSSSTMDFALEGNQILVRDANLEGNVFAIRGGTGRVGFDGNVDLKATVHMGPSWVGPLDLLWRALGNAFLRVRVDGTLRNPRPHPQAFGFLSDLAGDPEAEGPGPRPVDPPTRLDYPW